MKTIDRYDTMLSEMVNAFLVRKLPLDFGPDCGISFTPNGEWPTGTNLFTAEQARQMFKDCVPPECFELDDCGTAALVACSHTERCGA